jgi:hypothetical protein
MADVAINPQDITRASITPSYTGSLSVSDTYTVTNNGRVFLHFKKTGAGNCTVTITTPETVDGLAVADRTITVEATTGDRMVGLFPGLHYNTSGSIRFTCSDITGLSVAAFRV